MNLPPNAARAAEVLRKATQVGPVYAGDERERSIATIERARAAHRLRARLGIVATGLSVLGLLAVVWVHMGPGQSRQATASPSNAGVQAVALGAGASIVDSAGKHQLANPSQLLAGSRVLTKGGGGAQLKLSTGSVLRLDGNASVTVRSADSTQRFMLHSGSLLASVVELKTGERFIVDTADASVEVRGTAFTLSYVDDDGCPHESRTRLAVREGLVLVRTRAASEQVGPGQRWPAACWPESAAAKPKKPTRRVQEDGAKPTRKSVPTRKRVTVRSSIERQNDLFAEAVRARTAGDLERAIVLYQKFETIYPNSPLAQNASVERMRLLARTKPAQARQQARRYLKQYPGGFAELEARRLSGGP